MKIKFTFFTKFFLPMLICFYAISGSSTIRETCYKDFRAELFKKPQFGEKNENCHSGMADLNTWKYVISHLSFAHEGEISKFSTAIKVRDDGTDKTIINFILRGGVYYGEYFERTLFKRRFYIDKSRKLDSFSRKLVLDFIRGMRKQLDHSSLTYEDQVSEFFPKEGEIDHIVRQNRQIRYGSDGQVVGVSNWNSKILRLVGSSWQ